MESNMYINYTDKKDVGTFKELEIENLIVSAFRESYINVDIEDIEIQITITGNLKNDTSGTINANGKSLFTFTGNMQEPIKQIEHVNGL